MFFYIFFVVYIFTHLYVLHRIVHDFHLKGIPLNITLILLFIVMAVWSIYVHSISRNIHTDSILNLFAKFGYIWLGILSIIFSLFILRDIVHIFIRNNQFSYYSTLIACILAGICSGYSIFNVYRGPTVKNISINVPNLSVDKFTIIQLSDMHIDAFTSNKEIQDIVNTTNSFNPDIVVLVGDIIESDLSGSYKSYGLDNIKTKNGIFAVSGNHEYYIGISGFNLFCNNIGANILHNKNILVNDTIYIAGVADIYTVKRFNCELADVTKALQNIDFKKPVIFLSHQPSVFSESSKYPITIQLSAHTHAGQVPPFDLIEKVFFKYFYGLYKKDNSYLYVTSGTRWWGPPMRLFSRSEIVNITLYK